MERRTPEWMPPDAPRPPLPPGDGYARVLADEAIDDARDAILDRVMAGATSVRLIVTRTRKRDHLWTPCGTKLGSWRWETTRELHALVDGVWCLTLRPERLRRGRWER